ncbi:sulfite exporter TauE/SafE family protein [Roseibium salinum]|nr:sulfite exporter TauE/SafE family protein [Roseibium salinum]
MMELFASLFPDPLGTLAAILLIITSFFTSALTAAVGLGGGVALIAVMATLMPAIALVPVHGVVQLGSNAGRALVQLRHVDWMIALWFAIGAVFGAAIGGAIAVELPASILRAGIGLFVLWTVWGRMPRFGRAPRRAMTVAGFASTFLSMFFGAAGPIGGAVLATLNLPRHGFVANQAVTALIMHVFQDHRLRRPRLCLRALGRADRADDRQRLSRHPHRQPAPGKDGRGDLQDRLQMGDDRPGAEPSLAGGPLLAGRLRLRPVHLSQRVIDL